MRLVQLVVATLLLMASASVFSNEGQKSGHHTRRKGYHVESDRRC